jgi:hypothetical protein
MKFTDHKTVLKALETAQDAEQDLRDLVTSCQLFLKKENGQWEPEWWTQNDNKPRYQFDVTTPIIREISGEIRQKDFSIRVSPSGGNATRKGAELRDGMIRAIQNFSKAKYTYASANENCVIGGIDGWRCVSKYMNPDSFDQDLVIEPVFNFHQRVWFDTSSVAADRSDAKWCVVLHAPPVDEYEDRWPKGSGMSVGQSATNNAYSNKLDVVIVGELLYAKDESIEIVRMSNGRVYKIDDEYNKVKEELEAIGVTEDKKRKVKQRRFYSRFFDNNDWLEAEKKTPFKSCPVIPEYGNYSVLEDKPIYFGEVIKIMDPQRVLNYSLSREIEEGALAPRAKYWMTPKQAEGHEGTLATLNTNSDPVQIFNPDPELPGAPQQQGGAQINPGLRNISEALRLIVGHVAGKYAASMGDNPGLQSGVAIDKLQNKSDSGSYCYHDAHELAITRTGQVLIEAMPEVYDSKRMVRILNEDGTDETVTLYDDVLDQDTGKIVTLNDLNEGQYDVVCTAGPSFRNRQEQTMGFMLEYAQVDPSIMQLGGDLVLNSISFPAAQIMAKRRRAGMLQQGLIPEEEMTDEEKQKMMEAKQQQGQQQDPNALLAMAELEKAKAMNTEAETKRMALQVQILSLQLKAKEQGDKAMIDQAQLMLDEYNAETARITAQANAQKAGADAAVKEVQKQGTLLDNMSKVKELTRPQSQLSLIVSK